MRHKVQTVLVYQRDSESGFYVDIGRDVPAGERWNSYKVGGIRLGRLWRILEDMTGGKKMSDDGVIVFHPKQK